MYQNINKRLTKKEYDDIISNFIALKHKKVSNNIKKQTKTDGKQILKSKEVQNRMEINGVKYNSGIKNYL